MLYQTHASSHMDTSSYQRRAQGICQKNTILTAYGHKRRQTEIEALLKNTLSPIPITAKNNKAFDPVLRRSNNDIVQNLLASNISANLQQYQPPSNVKRATQPQLLTESSKSLGSVQMQRILRKKLKQPFMSAIDKNIIQERQSSMISLSNP